MTDNLKILEKVNSPADLQELPMAALEELAEELRVFLINSVSKTGGHLAPSLGVIELTIALHYLFDFSHDHLVWDVGHQSYAHKILTGRREQFSKLRQQGGISGFPKPSESSYDAFATGHSSTSISAALGMAVADQQLGNNKKSIAVIGDGALSGGMAFEALNHAGELDVDMLVILNDNDMSISPNVGGMSKYLSRILASRTYATMRESSRKVLSNVPAMWEFAKRTEEHMKGMVTPGTLFEELGFNYVGPLDGHNVDELIRTIRNMSDLKGPQLLHIVTQKGRGYTPAEQDPCNYHGVAKFSPESGELITTQETKETYTDIFADWLCQAGEKDKELVAITPAMSTGSGLTKFAERFPERFFDVGIAEQHALTFAAGLVAGGKNKQGKSDKKVVVAIYSTFLQRAYDQLIHDIVLQDLPIIFAVDRAGIVGADGPTHAGAFDLSFLRCIPDLVIMAPATGAECTKMFNLAHQLKCAVAIRYPRDSIAVIENNEENQLELGKGKTLHQGKKIAVLAFGSMVEKCVAVAEKLDATLVNMRFVKPLDIELLKELAKSHDYIVTVEENATAGGAGSAVGEECVVQSLAVELLHIGISDNFTGQGSRAEVLAKQGLDSSGIMDSISKKWNI